MDAEGILRGLNADQRAAVLHDHQKGAQLLILAGAGSGKTSVLTKRIQYRIAMGVNPENILALTFTAAAASEMRERVQALFPGAGVRLCTFHSLALYMLKQKIGGKFAYEMVGFKKPPVPQESADRDFMDELSRLHVRGAKFNRENLFDDSFSASVVSRLGKLRRSVLESGQVVFEDLIFQAIHLLEDHEEARAFFQRQWTEILVDEYQDINPSQYRMVKALLGDRNSLFVVGDDDQAIYGFRGADIGNINRFCEDFKQSTLIRLEWNYRSTPSILHLANDIFENKPLRLRKVLRAGNPKGSGGNPIFKENRAPEVWVSSSPIEEMLKIICKIKELRESYDLAWKNFAILVRYNRQRVYYEEVLRDAELPIAGEELEDGVVEDGIHVETVHASKGLQYAVVFYAGLAEGLTPGECSGSRRQRKMQLDEERRLYYVGVTRAEAYLILLYCKQRYWKGRLRNYRRSRFLPRSAKIQQGSNMPIILFKIRVVVLVLTYMFVHMLILPFMLIFRRKEVDLWLDKKIQSFARFCMKVLRIDLSVEDQAILGRVDWTRPVFVMGNHNSYADIPIIFLAIERTIGFIAKAELRFIPFLGFWMKKIGCVLINREKGGGAKLIREAMAKGRAPRLFIFPEGTRGKDENMVPFKSGGFRLAVETEATILPVYIKGSGFTWEHRKDSSRCKVTVKVLEPVDVKALIAERGTIDPRKDLMHLVRDRMDAAV